MTAAKPELARPTVLVVDDYTDTRQVLRRLLEIIDCRVVEAENGAEAIALAYLKRPNLIIIDLNMPVLDGLATVERLRALPRLEGTLIIAITAYDVYGMREAALEAGCTEYLAKPLDFERLGQLVRDLLTT